jgi:hypothetical protein
VREKSRLIILEEHFEEIHRKYRLTKNGKSSVDLLSQDSETKSPIKNLHGGNDGNRKMIDEVENMLIDLTKIIEESTVNRSNLIKSECR